MADVKSVPPASPVKPTPAPLYYLIIAALSQEAPQASLPASLLQHFLSNGLRARGRLLCADDLKSTEVMAELTHLFADAAGGAGIVVCYSGHCDGAGALHLQSKADGRSAETITPAQLLKAWSTSAAFKAGGSLFLLLNCSHSGVWAIAARTIEAERVWIQSSSTFSIFSIAFPALWIEYAIGRLSLAQLRTRLPVLPAAYAPARQDLTVLIGADDLKGSPLAVLFEKRDYHYQQPTAQHGAVTAADVPLVAGAVVDHQGADDLPFSAGERYSISRPSPPRTECFVRPV